MFSKIDVNADIESPFGLQQSVFVADIDIVTFGLEIGQYEFLE